MGVSFEFQKTNFIVFSIRIALLRPLSKRKGLNKFLNQ
jgi:hypothetical protein